MPNAIAHLLLGSGRLCNAGLPLPAPHLSRALPTAALGLDAAVCALLPAVLVASAAFILGRTFPCCLASIPAGIPVQPRAASLLVWTLAAAVLPRGGRSPGGTAGAEEGTGCRTDPRLHGGADPSPTRCSLGQWAQPGQQRARGGCSRLCCCHAGGAEPGPWCAHSFFVPHVCSLLSYIHA